MADPSSAFTEKFQRYFEMRAAEKREKLTARCTILCAVSGVFYLGLALSLSLGFHPNFGLSPMTHNLLIVGFTIVSVTFGMVRMSRAIHRPIALEIGETGLSTETFSGMHHLAWDNIDRIDRLNYTYLCLGDTLTFYAKEGVGITVQLNLIDQSLERILTKVELYRLDLTREKQVEPPEKN